MSRRRSTEPLPFAAWEPDRGAGSGAGLIARGVISSSKRYVPLPSPETYAQSLLVDTCQGAAGFYASDGLSAVFLGDARRLYRMSSRAPVDVSRLGGYTVADDWPWAFEQFGDNVVAAGRGAPLQRYILGSSSAFADIPGAPVAEVVFRVRGHLFACAGRHVNWSGFNDVTAWLPGAAAETQAGNTTVGQDAGIIVAGIGGEQGTLFQERGVVRIAYQGGDIPWVLDEVEGGRGALSPTSVRRWGRGAFVVAEDGFYFWNGLEAEPIGAGKVDQTFAADLNYAWRARVTTAIDPARKAWAISYPSVGSSTPDKLLVYSWSDGRWTHDDLPVEALFDLPREGLSLDDEAGLLALLGTLDVDQLTGWSVDSAAFRENRRTWACSVDRELRMFSGSPRAAEFEGGEVAPAGSQTTFVSEVHPVTDAAPDDVACAVWTRERLGATPTIADSTTMDDRGCCHLRVEGRFLRPRITISAGADWTEAVGFRWNAAPASER